MAGSSVAVALFGDDKLIRALNQFVSKAENKAELLDAIGNINESQTRRRLEGTKESPSGEPWPDWSTQYAKTRHSNHKLLENEGHLLDSLHSFVQGDQVETGTNLIYAATQQHGDEDRGIPAREFIGQSPEDEQELTDLLNDWIGGLMS